MRLVSVEQMRNLEKEADKNGLSFQKMMQNAGKGLGKEISRIAYSHYGTSVNILGLVGPGNNGGDTIIAMTQLADEKMDVTVYLIDRETTDDQLLEKFNEKGGKTINIENDRQFSTLGELLNNCDILIDGVLGTGFKLPLKEGIKTPLQKVNRILNDKETKPLIIAVDCPSGIDNDTGEISDESIPADITICMAAMKQGLLKLPAYEIAGKFGYVDVGFTNKNSSLVSLKNHVADEKMVRSLIIKRPLDAHKGTFGTAMIVAGSLNYAGAVLLAGRAAYQVGVGLVSLGIPAVLHTALAGHLPEATWLLLPNDMGSISGPAAPVLMKSYDKVSAMLVGCGMGIEDATFDFMESLLCHSATTKKNRDRIGFALDPIKDISEQIYKIPPLVVDADGLKLLARIPNWQKILPRNTILTPHPGEMEILTGVAKEKIQANRLSVAEHFAKEWQQTIVLKGAFTIIAAPDGSTTTIPVATPALSRAGTGDVLAGMIVGFLAQGLDASSSAIAGAWFHAQAGLLAAENLGGTTSVIASDIIDSISIAISSSNLAIRDL